MAEEKPKQTEEKEEEKSEEKKVETEKIKKVVEEIKEEEVKEAVEGKKKEASKIIKDAVEEVKQEATEKTKEEKSKEKPKKVPPKTPETPKKPYALAKGMNLHVSKKQSMYICSFIKNKHIDKAIADLELVIKMKKPVPFKGEIPHRKGKGIMSGRYPIKASELFIKLLKGLKGNVLVNNLDLDKTKIYLASASWASRPQRRNNRQAKRTNVTLKAKEILETQGGNK